MNKAMPDEVDRNIALPNERNGQRCGLPVVADRENLPERLTVQVMLDKCVLSPMNPHAVGLAGQYWDQVLGTGRSINLVTQ
jgi:hypothetical protein